MKKFLLIASDERSFLDLKNIAIELKSRNIPYFFLFNLTAFKNFPYNQPSVYNYDSNVPYSNTVFEYATLGFGLPFKPDVLIITNENWEPEKTILLEFKQKGTFIACVENSSWLYNNIKTKLEIGSRKSFPSNCIDIFFDHSEWCIETKRLAGFSSLKSIVTGNPRYDDIDFSDITEENIIIVYGSMEKEHHSRLLSIYTEIKDAFPEFRVFYKPHPNEVREFANDFNGINLINSQEENSKLVKSSKFNVGLFTSVMYLPLIYNKNIVYINNKNSGCEQELNIENFKGDEFNFWKKILEFNSFEEFESYINKDFIIDSEDRNKNLENIIYQNLLQYTTDMKWATEKSHNVNLLKYYDEFNDQQASTRIVNFLIS